MTTIMVTEPVEEVCLKCNYNIVSICIYRGFNINNTSDEDCSHFCYTCMYKHLSKNTSPAYYLIFDIFQKILIGYINIDEFPNNKAKIICNRRSIKKNSWLGNRDDLNKATTCSNCPKESCKTLRFYVTIPNYNYNLLVAFCGPLCCKWFCSRHQRRIKST